MADLQSMKIFIDTNVLIDYYADRKPFSDQAEIIVCLSNIAWDAYVSVLSFANIAYIFRKELTSETLKKIKNDMDVRMNLVSLENIDLSNAISLSFSDFEDALQASAAQKCGAEYIITRNCQDYIQSPIKALSPQDFLEMVRNQKAD